MMNLAMSAKTHVFANDDLRQVLHAAENDNDMQFSKTKIAMTLGPSSQSVDVLCQLLEAGATCARVDLTWNTLDFHRTSLRNLQEAMRRTKRLCAVMLDTMGREIMVVRAPSAPAAELSRSESTFGRFEAIQVESGSQVTLSLDPSAPCTPSQLPVSYAGLGSMVRPGDSLFVGRYLVSGADAGSVYLTVDRVTEAGIVCRARNSALLDGVLTVFHQERSLESVSNAQNELPVLAESDKAAVKALASEFEVDFLSLSYTRSAEDVAAAREWLSSERLGRTRVLAKLETRQSLFNLRAIVESCDGVIVSRGNLGLDVAPERVAMTQKAVAAACLLLDRPCIITRVVDTMVSTPRPTRAEATDVANAVLDGVDGILLGAETYRGAYVVETLKTIVAIAREAEAVFDHRTHFERLMTDAARLAPAPRAAPAPGLARLASMEASQSTGRAEMAGAGGGAPGAAPPASFPPPVPASPFPAARLPHSSSLPRIGSAEGGLVGLSGQRLSKLEAVASSAVRAGDKVGATLMIVVSQTGRAASLVAKYRPPMPIMALVVPYLKREGLRWHLEGRSTARQLLLTNGIVPVLAAPVPSAGASLVEEAVALAAAHGIVRPHHHVVVVCRGAMDEYMIKIVTVNSSGDGVKLIRPRSIADMLRARGQLPDASEDSQMTMADRRGSVILGGNRRDALVLRDDDDEDEDNPGRASRAAEKSLPEPSKSSKTSSAASPFDIARPQATSAFAQHAPAPPPRSSEAQSPSNSLPPSPFGSQTMPSSPPHAAAVQPSGGSKTKHGLIHEIVHAFQKHSKEGGKS